ncbi:2656_t:CDS:2, partial [Racocetra persica]
SDNFINQYSTNEHYDFYGDSYEDHYIESDNLENNEPSLEEPILDVVTRWNSMYDMCERAIALKVALDSIALAERTLLSDNYYSDRNFVNIRLFRLLNSTNLHYHKFLTSFSSESAMEIAKVTAEIELEKLILGMDNKLDKIMLKLNIRSDNLHLQKIDENDLTNPPAGPRCCGSVIRKNRISS